jgi:hypothetical protein
MTVSSLFKVAATIAHTVLKGLGFAVYGVVVTVRALFGLPHTVVRLHRLLGDTITCPWCHAVNATTGRWNCATCGGQYLGFVGHCTICRAGASFFPCHRCGGSIVIGGAT